MQVGDVVVRGKSEAWLTGAIVLREGTACRAAVFLASQASGHPAEAVVVLPGGEQRVAWVERRDGHLPSAIVPDTLELAGDRLTRCSRIPVSIEAQGAAPEGLGETGTWTRYEAPSGAAAFVLAASSRILWVGGWLAEGEWTILAAGSATLREL